MQRVEELIKAAADRETSGDLAAAYALCEQALAADARHPAANERAAHLAERLGRRAEASQHYRIAVATAPHRSDLRLQLVQSLLEANDPSGAQAEAEALALLEPKDWRVLDMLGIALRRQRRQTDAIVQFEKAARLNPKAESPWVNLGNVQRDLRNYDKAIAAYRKAQEIAPNAADIVRLLGATLCEAGKAEEGLAALGRAIMMDERKAESFQARAVALHNLARIPEAYRDIERALALKPGAIAYRRLRGVFAHRLGRLKESRETYEGILKDYPDDVLTLKRYGQLCQSLGDHRTANEALRRALALRPGDGRLAAQLCRALMDSRYDVEGKFIDQAHAIAAQLCDAAMPPIEVIDDLQGVFLRTADFKRAEKIAATKEVFEHWIAVNKVSALHNQLGRVRTLEDRYRLVDYHRAWGRQVSARAKPLPPSPRRPLAGRKLRIGLMSSDLRHHAVSYFALPIIEHYDRARCEIFCYSFYPQPADQVQAFIAQNVAAFRLMPDATNDEVATRMREDEIDILFELGGTTRYNRLEVLTLRPAPVQVSWLGYPHSAGLAEIDYILVDPYLKPEDPKLLIERPFLMPESWVSIGQLGFNDGWLGVWPGLPEERAGHLTFGTANNPYKYSADLVTLWAKVMVQVPDSHFLFIRPEGGSAAFRKNIGDAFEQHGVSASRLDFEPVRGTHLTHYNRIDIALDSCPHTGGTTTCESLWMGVPTVTLIGPAFFERLSYSNLSNAGLGDLCARTPEQYVEIAAALAADRPRRAALRQGLRAQIRAHPLGQPQRWVRHFEEAAAQAAAEAS